MTAEIKKLTGGELIVDHAGGHVRSQMTRLISLRWTEFRIVCDLQAAQRRLFHQHGL